MHLTCSPCYHVSGDNYHVFSIWPLREGDFFLMIPLSRELSPVIVSNITLDTAVKAAAEIDITIGENQCFSGRTVCPLS